MIPAESNGSGSRGDDHEAASDPAAIPILNIYYLLCYAWNHVQEQDTTRLQFQPHHTALDLLGKVLAGGVNHLLRRGLDRGYLERREDLAGIRGKLAVSETAKRVLKARARAACDFEELSPDILRNRILQASLRRLLSRGGIDLSPDVRKEVRSAFRKMPSVSGLRLTRGAFTRVQLAGGNRKLYRFLLSVCRLIHNSLLVDERTGRTVFRDFRRDKATMWRLFEDFALGFYRSEQREFRVRGQSPIRWSGTEGTSDANRALIPGMKADLVLESSHRRIIIDTKFYQTVLPGDKLSSSNLYQLLAYLRNRQATLSEGSRHEGILLYAQPGKSVRADVHLDGFQVQALTVNLNRPWREIHQEMLAVLRPPDHASAGPTSWDSSSDPRKQVIFK